MPATSLPLHHAQAKRVRGFGHIRDVDPRGILSNTFLRLYKQWRDNELHPEDKGFELIAAKSHAAIPKRGPPPGPGRKDDRMAEKVIVTNESALRAKYGDEGWSDVRAEVENLIAADDRRGLKTMLVRLDRAQDMKPLGARVVQNARSEKQNKEAIDGVWEAKTLDYLLILGGPDVVPHQTLPNPVGGAGGDGDNTVASDLPYACDAPGGGGIEAYLAPTRAVGRLPNVFGDSKSAYLLRLLRFARRWRSRARKGYKTGFVLTASVWSGSTRQSARRLFGTSKGVHLSPPKGPVWPMAQLARRTHFINCHGAPLDPRYYGEDASGSVPVAHRSTQLAGLTEGTVAAAECCYGAELYDPSLLDTPKGIANAYLYKGTAGFLGSTTIAYGPASGNDKADLICLYFVREALKGASVGRAALEARLDYLRSTRRSIPWTSRRWPSSTSSGTPRCTRCRALARRPGPCPRGRSVAPGVDESPATATSSPARPSR